MYVQKIYTADRSAEAGQQVRRTVAVPEAARAPLDGRGRRFRQRDSGCTRNGSHIVILNGRVPCGKFGAASAVLAAVRLQKVDGEAPGREVTDSVSFWRRVTAARSRILEVFGGGRGDGYRMLWRSRILDGRHAGRGFIERLRWAAGDLIARTMPIAGKGGCHDNEQHVIGTDGAHYFDGPIDLGTALSLTDQPFESGPFSSETGQHR